MNASAPKTIDLIHDGSLASGAGYSAGVATTAGFLMEHLPLILQAIGVIFTAVFLVVGYLQKRSWTLYQQEQDHREHQIRMREQDRKDREHQRQELLFLSKLKANGHTESELAAYRESLVSDAAELID